MQSTSLDLRFLENLKQRLRISNRRSIHLNALSGRYLTRLDLSALNQIEDGLAQEFVNKLLSNPKSGINIRIAPEKLEDKGIQKIIRRLSSMLIENQDHYAEHGVETFGFGYPILLRRDSQDPTRIIKAPMFIWSLDIKRNWRKAHEWEISRQEDYSVVSNLSLAAHLLSDLQIQLAPLYDHLMDDGLLDKDELAGILYKQYSQLIFEPTASLHQEFRQQLDASPETLPTAKEIEELDLDQPKIIWSGVFGLFRSPKESIAKDVDQFISSFDDFNNQLKQLEQNKQIGRSSFMKHTFALVDTDPSQQHLLHALGRGHNLIIQGPPGTGKSQTLTGIITNAISNGGRCLVVCEKKTALEVLYNNLKALGLGELAVIVEDVYRDRRKLVSSVRERLQHQPPPYKPSPNFIRLLQSCAMQVQRLQKYHEKLLAPICNSDKWSTVVAKCMAAQEEFPKERLEPYLKARDFKFSPEEFEVVSRMLTEGEPLFRALGSLQHPFNAFHERFFEIPNTHQVSTELKKSVDDLLHVVESAQTDLLAYLYQYEKLLEEHYSQVLAQKGRLADEVIDMIENGLKASKFFFNKNKGAVRNLLTGISKKHKQLQEDKITILKNYTLLKNQHERYEYFDHKFVSIANIKEVTFEDIKKNTEDYQEKISDWYGKKDAIIREYVNNLKTGFVHPHVDFKKQTKEITRNLDLFAQNFMKSKVFKVPFGFKNAIIRDRLNNLEELDENLKKLSENFEDEFAAYHPLKFFWLNLDKAQQAAFQGLASANVDNWLGHFKSWYLHHLLNAYADENIPQESHYRNIIRNLKKEEKEMRQGLIHHSLHYWRARQAQAVKKFNQEKAPLKVHSIYNLRGNTGGRRTPLRQIFEADPELFTSFYPVLMVNPSVCASMLPLQPHLFDVVIFDEASQLRLEDTFSALMRANYKVVSGDSQQMPPSAYFQTSKVLVEQEEMILDDQQDPESWELEQEAIDYLSSSESLLEYSIADGNYKEEFLQLHYRSKHPFLIDFSNAAFYGRRLTPMPPQEDYCPILFHAVDGIYKDGINPQEAELIVSKLLAIAKAVDPLHMPSVGVATFNMHQRNHILELIQKQMVEDVEAAGLFESLFNKGLFVKNLENIQGDERDILLISTTFGPKEDGSFLQNFGPLNRQQGYRLLNVIITRAKHQIELFTSIPAENYSQYRQLIQTEGNNGKAILYAYLNYAKAVSEGDETSRQAILDLLFDQCIFKPIYNVNNTFDEFRAFENLVCQFLIKNFPDFSIKQNDSYAGFPIPLLVKNEENQKAVALYFDLFHEYASEEAYAWDMFREKHLTKMGFAVGRVWSYSWWQNTEAEKSRILALIKKELKD
jgi:DNA polymerase III delta prime subunit